MNEPHRHNQNLVGTLHATSLLWFTQMKTAIIGGTGEDSFVFFGVETGVSENSVIVDLDAADDKIVLLNAGFGLE